MFVFAVVCAGTAVFCAKKNIFKNKVKKKWYPLAQQGPSLPHRMDFQSWILAVMLSVNTIFTRILSVFSSSSQSLSVRNLLEELLKSKGRTISGPSVSPASKILFQVFSIVSHTWVYRYRCVQVSDRCHDTSSPEQHTPLWAHLLAEEQMLDDASLDDHLNSASPTLKHTPEQVRAAFRKMRGFSIDSSLYLNLQSVFFYFSFLILSFLVQESFDT